MPRFTCVQFLTFRTSRETFPIETKGNRNKMKRFQKTAGHKAWWYTVPDVSVTRPRERDSIWTCYQDSHECQPVSICGLTVNPGRHHPCHTFVSTAYHLAFISYLRLKRDRDILFLSPLSSSRYLFFLLLFVLGWNDFSWREVRKSHI